MRSLANLFLVLFAVDGILSFFDEFTSQLFPVHALSGLRVAIANLVFLTAIAVYLSLGIDRRLPKRVFLPLTLFVIWCPISLLIFPALVGNRSYGLLMAAGQLLLCLLPVSEFGKRKAAHPELLHEVEPELDLRRKAEKVADRQEVGYEAAEREQGSERADQSRVEQGGESGNQGAGEQGGERADKPGAGEQIVAGLLMPKARFSGPFFSLRNTLIFTAANVVAIPIALVLCLFVGINSLMDKYASGFMHLAPDGLHMTEKIYRRGNKTIRLAGMIHVGEKEYYDSLVRSVAPGRTIVLAEGVTDKDDLLRDKPQYDKVAGYLGLSSQHDKLHFSGRVIDEDELDEPESQSSAGAKAQGGLDILRADVDVSSFHPPTIAFLNELGKQMKQSHSLAREFFDSNGWTKKYATPQVQQVIIDDILYSRNKEVIRDLRKVVDRYDTILIPWGALHMMEIEADVKKQGFELQQVKDRVSIDFRKSKKPNNLKP
jgi:hypothetical protein